MIQLKLYLDEDDKWKHRKPAIILDRLCYLQCGNSIDGSDGQLIIGLREVYAVSHAVRLWDCQIVSWDGNYHLHSTPKLDNYQFFTICFIFYNYM